MNDQKMKKIIFEPATIVLVFLIIAVNVQAMTENNQLEHENKLKYIYPYFIIGNGFIGSMAINDQKDKIGKLEGSLYIWNSPGTNSPDYKLFIFNKSTNKLLNKKNLPEQFTLQGFVGFGYISDMNIPHGPHATRYFIIGKAMELIE